MTAAVPAGAATVGLLGLELPLEMLVLGAVTGLSYSILAVGLVLVYRSSRVLNFAHGEMGALASGLVPLLVAVSGWNYWTAIALALVAAAFAGAATDFLVIRRLARAPRLVALVATIGVSQVFFAVSTFVPKGERLGSIIFPTPFQGTVGVGTLTLNAGHLLVLGVVPVVTAMLAVFLRRTDLGLAARAAAENRDAARSVGVRVDRVSLLVWTLAGLTAGVAAILLGPTRPVFVREALGPSLLLRALAAAMVGGLVSLPWAFVGGLVVGVVELTASWNFAGGGRAGDVALFLLIVVTFLARRGLGHVHRGGEQSSWSLAGAVRDLDPRLAAVPVVRALRTAAPAAVVVGAFLVPLIMTSSQRVLFASVVLFALMGLSLTVLTGYAGQVSLGQFAFVALGAVVGGRLLQLGYPHWVAVVYAVAAGGIVAALAGLPALRVRGLLLAVVTLAFAVAADGWMYHQDWLVSQAGAATSLTIPRPAVLGLDGDLGYLWLCLVVLTAVALGVRRLRETGVGRAMMAVRDNEAGAASLGVAPWRAKVTAFVLSGMLAALAGFLYGGLLVHFGEPDIFAPEWGLVLLAMVILGGVTTVTGAIAGAVFVRGSAIILGPLLPQYLGSSVALIVSGLGLLVAVLQFPGGIAGELARLRDRLAARVVGVPRGFAPSARELGLPRPQLAPAVPTGTARPAEGATATEAPGATAATGAAAIAAHDVTVAFGGNRALDRVSLHADRGELVGLVGPNGAGKTTLFDVLAGQRRPDEGVVLLRGRDITSLPPYQRARLGVGRTFQQAGLFADLTVLDVLRVALERTEPSEVVPSLLALPPSHAAERRKDLRASELVELLGLEPYAHLRTRELSTGMRRIVELGTVVALGADVLLLDEPTAGIAQREVEAFRPVLTDIQAHLGATVVVIEHDLPMVLDLVDRLYVLAAGRVIAAGDPTELRESPVVIAAYLGTDPEVVQRSGESVTVTT